MRTTRFIRGTVVAVLIGLVFGLTGGLPARAAPLGQLCKDAYAISKAPPARGNLPGLGQSKETVDANNRPYGYRSPGENVRGLAQPGAAERLKYGTDPKGKEPGTLGHVSASWFKYLDRKQAELAKWQANPVGKKPSPALSWTKWLNSYIPNQGNDARGKAYEEIIAKEIGLGGNDWRCQHDITENGEVRRYDAFNEKENVAYEMKSGRTIDPRELAKDARIVANRGTRVVYLFGDQPTRGTITRLRNAGVDYHVMKATPSPVNPHAPVAAPNTTLMNPSPAQPSEGAFVDEIGAAGASAEEAAEVAAVESELAEESGAFTQQLLRPGGIDFSSMQLRYVSDTGGVQYSFAADQVADEDAAPGFGGLQTAQLASDSLFTWLALPPSAFWVNLNPTQPDNITDPRLAKTDAGRVLLSADLLLKRTNAILLNPETELGDRFWDAVHFDSATTIPCLPMRLWITPDTASVREEDGRLYILDAPLTVNAEFFPIPALPDGATCQQSDEVAKQNVAEYQKIVLPAMTKAVNTDPGYADLRRVYLSRVAAEWLIQRKSPAFASVIGSNNVTRWPSRTAWSPQAIFQDYLKSYKKGDFTYHRQVQDHGQTVTVTFAYGGVDFSAPPKKKPLSTATFVKEHPTLPATVKSSASVALTLAGTDADATWLGGGTGIRHAVPARPGGSSPGGGGGLPITGPPVALITASGLVLLMAGAGLLAWLRRRRQPQFRA